MTLSEKLQKYIDRIAMKAMGPHYAYKFERDSQQRAMNTSKINKVLAAGKE